MLPASASEVAQSSSTPSTSSRATPVRRHLIPPLQDPLLEFLTNLMMKDGKKETARKHVSLVLTTLRLRSASDPVALVKEAVDIASPSVKMAQFKKGGAKGVAVPLALNMRQKQKKAIDWILDASDKRQNPAAGGSKKFGERVAYEMEAVLNGTSDVLKKKEQLHNSATVSRANVLKERQ